MIALPMPNETFDGRTIVASTWLRDGFTEAEREQFKGEPEYLALVMLLNPGPPYYAVAQLAVPVGDDAWQIAATSDFPNINFATEDYAESGGDV